jgi:DNA-binding response OmpR family regulator
MKKVLVLEDETSIRSFVVINLKRAGYEPIEAGTGAEAFEQLKAHPDIKVALLDIMLPRPTALRSAVECGPRFQNRHHHADSAHTGDGQSDRSDDRCGRLCDEALLPAELTARVDALYRRMGGAETTTGASWCRGPSASTPGTARWRKTDSGSS